MLVFRLLFWDHRTVIFQLSGFTIVSFGCFFRLGILVVGVAIDWDPYGWCPCMRDPIILGT